ncbi:MAG: hypothetical protein K6F14_05675 [Clostridiales bacterium]|nr:hypothetical protein [Clostridiales bacterium]
MNKKKLVIFATLVLVGMIIAAVIPTIIVCAGLKLEVRSTDIDYLEGKYLKTNGFYSDFIVFPRSLDNVKTINDYYYIDYQLKDGCIVVLDVMYDKTGFDNEIARLDNQIVRNHNGAEGYFYKKLKYVDDGVLFNCPVYVATYRYYEYEYVCVDYESMRCIYVYMKYLSYDKIPLDEKYIPIDYQINESRKEEGGYKYTVYP